jgi:hypothetical protein
VTFSRVLSKEDDLEQKLFSKYYNSQNGGNLHPFNMAPQN